MRRRVIVFPALDEFEELLGPAFLKETHERAPDCFHLGTRDLRDLAIAIDEAASDLLELEVPSDVGVDEDFGKFTRRDDELGDEINGVVPVAAKLRGRRLIRPELAIQLQR